MSGYAADKGVPLPGVAVIVGAMLLILGGLSSISGYQPVLRIGLLVLFLMPVSMLMHNFWTVTDPQMQAIEQGLWMRNMALAGAGLFLLAVPRPWSWSIDARAAARRTYRPTATQATSYR